MYATAVVRTTTGKKMASKSNEREKVVMMREQTRILWKKTEKMDTESSVQSSKFEVHPLSVYEEGPYQCG